MMLERAPPARQDAAAARRRSMSTDAVRARRARARRNAGLVVLQRLLVNRRRFVAALRAAHRGELADAGVEEITAAAGQVIEDFIERWLENKPTA
jgi:hypothetical protein